MTERDASNQSDIKNNSEQSRFEESIMTGSYGEISLSEDSSEVHNLNPSLEKERKRPESLTLPPNASTVESAVNEERDLCLDTNACASNSDETGLSELEGTLSYDGDLVTFVAEDLQEKIKMSSPVSLWADSVLFSGNAAKSLQPDTHIVDATVLSDLEVHTRKIATCVDQMLENLCGTLQSISSLTVDCMENYEKSVCKTCDAVDINIKAVYQLMAKCEELSKSMNSMYLVADDVKKIKKLLDHLE